MGHGRPLEAPVNSSTRDPRFATCSMGVVGTSPLRPVEGRRRGYKQVRELALIASTGSGSGGLTHSYTSSICIERRRVSMREHGTAKAG
jgi:hypothetical protein